MSLLRSKKIFVASSILLVSIFAVQGLTSCNSSENKLGDALQLSVDDSMNLLEKITEKDETIDVTKLKFSTEDSKVARALTDGTLIGYTKGSTVVSATLDDIVIYQKTVEVSDYTHLTTTSANLSGSGYSMTIGGFLIDLNVGAYLAKGKDYTFLASFKGCANDSQEFFVSMSDESVAEYEYVIPEGSTVGKPTVRAKKVGDSIFTITNADGFICYREVIQVRRGFTSNIQAVDYLTHVDQWTNWGFIDSQTPTPGSCKMAFLSGTSGILTGKDGGADLGTIEFTFKYDSANSTDDEFIYMLDSFPNTATDLKITKLALSSTGDMIHVSNSTILLDVFIPKSN